MSPRDAPYWARGVAALLLCFATWWLLGTQALRSVVGDSIAPLSLGVIAIFMLRGLQLPLGVWPDGPWRHRFSAPRLIGVAAVFAVLMGVVIPWPVPGLGYELDIGTAAAVVIGVVTWGFAMAFVRQRPYVKWYAVAVGLGVAPTVLGLLFSGGIGETETSLARLASTELLAIPELVSAKSAAAVPTFLHLVAVGAASKLVTEEIAFRRLLLGVPTQAGIVPVTLAALVAAIWYGIVLQTGADAAAGTALQFGLAALCAGALYALSRSLLVSATFSASYWAAFATFAVARESPVDLEASAAAPPQSVAILTMVSGIALGVFVVRQNGWWGGPSKPKEGDVTGH